MILNELSPMLNSEPVLLDVTDKSLYSFNEHENMALFRNVAATAALDRFFSLADSDAAHFAIYMAEKVPYIKDAFDAIKGETEIVAKLSANARKKLESGEWKWLFADDGSGMLPALYDNVGKHFAEQIRVGEQTIRPELMGALMSLVQKSNLDALTEKVIYLTGITERIAVGQYNDRVAMFYGARQMYIAAMSMDDPENRRVALLNAASSADSAIAALQQTIRYDLNNLASIKSSKQLEESTKLIAKCFSKLNDSVQISVNVYSALGEHRALLSAVTCYQCFVEQTLLAIPDNVHDKTYSGCTLAEIMHSCSSGKDTDWRHIPNEIVDVCNTIIQTERQTIDALSAAIEHEMLGGTGNEGM